MGHPTRLTNTFDIDRWWATYNAAVTGVLANPTAKYPEGFSPVDHAQSVHMTALFIARHAHGAQPELKTIQYLSGGDAQSNEVDE